MSKTIVLNLIAGPGAGKSTIASGVFYKLKCLGIECELAYEYAKDCVWNESFKNMEDQIYMFGKQYHKIWRLQNKVQVIIADSPLILSIYYKNFDSKFFDNFVLEQFNMMNNVTYFIDRNIEFVQNGRVHTEKESKNIDKFLDDFLQNNNIEHTHVLTTEAIDKIVNDIVNYLEE